MDYDIFLVRGGYGKDIIDWEYIIYIWLVSLQKEKGPEFKYIYININTVKTALV